MKRQEGRKNRVSLGTSTQLSAADTGCAGGGERRRDEHPPLRGLFTIGHSQMAQ